MSGTWRIRVNNKIKSADKKRLPLWSKILIGILIAVILLGGIAYGVFKIGRAHV